MKSRERKSVPNHTIERGKPEASIFAERDALGRLIRLIDAQGHTRIHEYDGLSRPARIVDPDAGERKYRYDDNGNLEALTTPLGQVTSTFDALDRPLETVATSASGAPVSRAAFHYDLSPPVAFDSKNYLGRVAWHEDDSGKQYYQYDERGRSLRTRRELDGRSFDTSQTYDTLDRLTSVTYPNGFTLEFETDELGRTVRMPGLLDAVEYDARGSIVSMSLNNGVVETRGWDVTGRLSRLTVSTKSKPIRDSAFAYDGRGNIETVSDDTAPALRSSYAYDDLSRLTGAQLAAKNFEYAYSADGSLTQVNSEAVTYDAAHPHAATRMGASAFEYGPAGQLVKWAGNTGEFDARGKLRKVTTASGLTEYTYDAFGSLAKQVGPQGTQLFVSKYFEVTPKGEFLYAFLGTSRLAKFQATASKTGCDTGNSSMALTALGLGVLLLLKRERRKIGYLVMSVFVACPSPKATTSAVTYFHHDPVGSTQFTTDSLGAASGFSTYSPFGQALQKSAETYTFAGRHNDETTGLSFWPMRQLAMSTGRFNSPDVHSIESAENMLAQPQSLNPYAYARNNPIRFEDKQGNFEEPIHGALTYHLAMAAGFTQPEAKQIALASAGVDHDPATRPTPPNKWTQIGLIEMALKIGLGITEQYHFQTPGAALGNVRSHASEGASMNLTEVGKHIHTLEDVGFVDALGPHMRGSPSLILGTVFSSRGGHPTGTAEDGSWTHWLLPSADIPFHSPSANTAVMQKVFGELVRLATAKNGVDSSADALTVAQLIEQGITAKSAADVQRFLGRPGAKGEHESYTKIVDEKSDKKGQDPKKWRVEDIDNGIK